jgi:hypothetical protein
MRSGIFGLRSSAFLLFAAVPALSLILMRPAATQVLRESPSRICRKLVPGDKYYPAYRSCCDIDGGRSRWQSADGKITDYTSMCALWGIKPGAPGQQLQPPPGQQRSSKGIPPGRYRCPIGSPVEIVISGNGSYRTSDGSTGAYRLSSRERDAIGGYARYSISGGAFNSFQFLHRDNGQLQVGRTGWGRCEPR